MNFIESNLKLERSWKKYLSSELKKPYIEDLSQFLASEIGEGKVVFPTVENIFAAFNITPINKVKVVILGQDPYHGVDQAHGLCFSVKQNIKTPPSLFNIYKELKEDMKIEVPEHGNLQNWASEGVLLLNSVLTVEESMAASHKGKGWEKFTDKVIDVLNKECKNLVFILWGGYAQKKGSKIDKSKHLVLNAPHPSPLSVYRGFYGSKPFSQANAYLKKHGIKEINWDPNSPLLH